MERLGSEYSRISLLVKKGNHGGATKNYGARVLLIRQRRKMMVGERRKSKGSPDMEGSSELMSVSPRRHHQDYQHYLNIQTNLNFFETCWSFHGCLRIYRNSTVNMYIKVNTIFNTPKCDAMMAVCYYLLRSTAELDVWYGGIGSGWFSSRKCKQFMLNCKPSRTGVLIINFGIEVLHIYACLECPIKETPHLGWWVGQSVGRADR